MPKDRYYFSHDYHARNDPKLQRVLMDMGVAGIGAYWCLVEMLYEEGGELSVEDIPVIARQLKMQVRSLEKLINFFGLFETFNGVFKSFAVNDRLFQRNMKSDIARNSADIRWEKHANALRTQKTKNANAMLERKGNKRKGKERIIIPDFIDKDLWDSFIEMRRKLRAAPTDRAIELLIKELGKLRDAGHDPKKVLEQSIANSWRGLFPLKGDRNGTHQQVTPQSRTERLKASVTQKT